MFLVLKRTNELAPANRPSKLARTQAAQPYFSQMKIGLSSGRDRTRTSYQHRYTRGRGDDEGEGRQVRGTHQNICLEMKSLVSSTCRDPSSSVMEHTRKREDAQSIEGGYHCIQTNSPSSLSNRILGCRGHNNNRGCKRHSLHDRASWFATINPNSSLKDDVCSNVIAFTTAISSTSSRSKQDSAHCDSSVARFRSRSPRAPNCSCCNCICKCCSLAADDSNCLATASSLPTCSIWVRQVAVNLGARVSIPPPPPAVSSSSSSISWERPPGSFQMLQPGVFVI